MSVVLAEEAVRRSREVRNDVSVGWAVSFHLVRARSLLSLQFVKTDWGISTPTVPSRPVPSRSAVGKSLAVAPRCGLAGWSLHSRTKWQRKKSADLTTALPSRHSDRLGFHIYAFDLPVYAAFNGTFTASCSVDCAHQNWNLKISLLRYIKHYLVAKIKLPISL